MTLSEYLEKRRLTMREFAVASGISLATVCRIANGRGARWPSMAAVMKASRGRVTFADMQPRKGGGA